MGHCNTKKCKIVEVQRTDEIRVFEFVPKKQSYIHPTFPPGWNFAVPENWKCELANYLGISKKNIIGDNDCFEKYILIYNEFKVFWAVPSDGYSQFHVGPRNGPLEMPARITLTPYINNGDFMNSDESENDHSIQHSFDESDDESD
jgi:hypothetical protein